MTFERSYGQPELNKDGKLDKYFDSIIKVLKREAITGITRAQILANEKGTDFTFDGKTMSELLDEIDKATIIKPKTIKTKPTDLYPLEFVRKFGMTEEQFDDIISRYL